MPKLHRPLNDLIHWVAETSLGARVLHPWRDATTQRRLRVIAGRWVGLIGCGVVASAIVIVIEPALHRFLRPAVNHLSALKPPVMAVLVTVLVGAACWAAGRRRWRGFWGLRFFFAYPPLWLAVVVALLTWIGWHAWANGAASVTLLADIGWFTQQIPHPLWWGMLLVATIAILRRHWKERNHGDELQPGTLSEDFNELRAWLRQDHEIDSPHLDRFGHDDIARRIAGRLVQEDEAPTIAVVGRLGSGKSTIRQLTAFHLRAQPKVRLVHVSLWPFDSVEAAVHGILQALVRELGRDLNVLPLVGVSDDYVAAIEKTTRGYGGIVRLLRGASDPQRIVERISNIASAAGLRLVVWVEDLERFSGGDQLDDARRVKREVERLGPIRALLHLLDRCPQVSVVVSDTSLHTRFDIGKIARFVEEPPSVNRGDAWGVIETLRARCLADYPITVIDPAWPNSRRILEDDAASEWLEELDDSNPDLPAAIVQVLDTPRALKWALRLTLETWERLAGEIDFDSILVASVLRVTYPDIFALVSERINLFRHGLIHPLRDKETPHPIVAQVEARVDREDAATAGALRAILSFLFPKYPPEKGKGESDYIARPQALFVNSHVDYWRRYLSQEAVPQSRSDQRALTNIRAWRERDSSDLIDRVVDSERSDQIEAFVGQFQPSDVCRLLIEVANRLTTQSAAGWEFGVYSPAIVAVWRMMRARRPSEDAAFEAVMKVVLRTAPLHLPLGEIVKRLFAGPSTEGAVVGAGTHQQEVSRELKDVLMSRFLGDSGEERLAEAVREGSPWIVARASGGITDEDIASDRWPRFANVLLKLAERKPEVGVPLVVAFVTDSGRSQQMVLPPSDPPKSVEAHVGQFDEAQAKRLFDFEQLMDILSDFEAPDELGDEMKECCRVASDAARRHVAAARDEGQQSGAGSGS